MEHFVSTEWISVMAVLQILFAASLLLISHTEKRAALRSILRTIEAYFYSFSPAALLAYILYKVSYMH